MIGHNAIVNLRLEGYRPAELWLVLHEERPAFSSFTHPETLMHTGGHPEVHVLPDEAAETLDLRFVRGILVHIVGQDEERCGRALRRVAEFEPAKAITAGEGWMLGWKPGLGFIDFLKRRPAQ